MKQRRDEIQALWDRLAEFPVARTDEAFAHLMSALCELFGAWNAGWIAAVRMADAAARDPVGGWRARSAGYLELTEAIESARRAQFARLEAGEVDPTVPRNLAGAGSWRANRLVDLADADWFDSEAYRRYYLASDRADVVWVGCPVNCDAELFIGLFRRDDQPRFTRDEAEGLLGALRGLKWFFRQHLLSHGLTVAEAPLTPTEREILKELLAGASWEEIAERGSRSLHTVHHHCKSLYQKFGVGNRVSLMAMWLGLPAPAEEPAGQPPGQQGT